MDFKERWKEGILNALFPPRCILCDEVLEEKGYICSLCREKELFMEEPSCKSCGRSILRQEESLCGNCKRHHFSFSGGMMLYQLTEEIEGAITELKYHGRIQGIVPVPIHKERRRKRGYNQAEIIGKGLEKQTGIPLYSDVLQRNKKTKALKDCSPAERLQNLFSAMDCGELPEELKRILLVDDIFTTGATMEACSRKLLDAGAEEVYILAIAGRAES